MKDPFSIQKTCYTSLTRDEIKEIIRQKTRSTGMFSRSYRGFYRNERLIILAITGKDWIRISGTAEIAASQTKIDLKCRPVCSPLYILIPLFILFVVVGIRGPVIINDEFTTWLQTILFLLLGFLFTGGIVSLPTYLKTAREYKILAQELQLRTTFISSTKAQ